MMVNLIWRWYLDDDRVTWENEGPYEIFGPTREDRPVSGAEFRKKIIHPEDAGTFERAVSSMLECGTPFHFQGRINRYDGSTAWVELAGQLEYCDDGRPRRVLGTMLDITEHRRREAELRSVESLGTQASPSRPNGSSSTQNGDGGSTPRATSSQTIPGG